MTTNIQMYQQKIFLFISPKLKPLFLQKGIAEFYETFHTKADGLKALFTLVPN